MKKLLLFCSIALLCNVVSFAQGNFQPKLSDFIPPSPTAYQLTKYGDIPVNESTGMANINIPLFNFGTKNIRVPINLSYTTSGIKVNQVATWVGMGWSLNSGGIITRNIRGVADEKAIERKFLSYSGIMSVLGTSSISLFLDMVDDVNDYQPDLFSFNVAGFSGNFYLDSNFNPVITKRTSEIKITKLGYNDIFSEFLITTPDGMKYYFGGEDGIEYSKTETTTIAGHGFPTFFLPTSWLLKKIVHPNGQEVYFDYNYAAEYFYDTGVEQEYARVVYFRKMLEGCANPPEGLTTTTFRTHIKSRKLSKIYSNERNDTLVFHASKSRSDLTSEYKLDSITLKDGNNTIKGYNLNYSFITSNGTYYSNSNSYRLSIPEYFKRMFLTSVKETDSNGNETNGKIHSFVYEDPASLPPRISFSQDLLGYYNGKQNTSFLPGSANTEIDHYLFSGVNRGDRSANFTYAQKGILTDIIYPTKGVTSLEYEGAIELITTTSDITSNFSMNVNNSQGQDIFVDEFTSLYNQEIFLNPNVNILLGQQNSLHTQVSITIKEKGTTNIIFDQIVNHNTDGTFKANLNANVTYEITVSFVHVKLVEVEVIIQFNYKSGESSSTSPKNKAGIRVKKIKKKASSIAPEEIIRYHYSTKENLNQSEFKQLRSFSFIKASPFFNGPMCNNNDPWALNHIYQYVRLKSSSVIHDMTLMPEFFMYKTVTKSYGENFEGGGVEKHFEVNPHNMNSIVWGEPMPQATRTNLEGENGRLLKEVVFDKKDGIIHPLEEKSYVYKKDESKSSYIDCFVGEKLYDNNTTGPDPYEEIKHLNLSSYRLYKTWSSIDSIKIKRYFENDSITTIQKNIYQTGLAGLPTEVTTTDSKGNTLKTQYVYPTSGTLKDQNRLEVLETKTFKGSALLSHQKTEYKDWGSGIILPEFIKTAKGSNALEDRIVFHKYDDKSNPISVSKKDGTHIVYIWGYHQTKPIAKIENATEAEVTTAIGTLNGNYNTLTEIQTLSNNDTNGFTENTLRTALNDLRAVLPNAMMSSFTYDPLIGVTSVTDPRGK
ncbi:MAG: hypothetical protein HWD85_08285, partial [Flavobacteriaceae bacterium]|nr:hypothetical protein [Flavobacteriaceae bacterium]